MFDRKTKSSKHGRLAQFGGNTDSLADRSSLCVGFRSSSFTFVPCPDWVLSCKFGPHEVVVAVEQYLCYPLGWERALKGAENLGGLASFDMRVRCVVGVCLPGLLACWVCVILVVC